MSTVAPVNKNLPSSDGTAPLHSHRNKVSELSKYHPYNVLWAQLGDLYGSVGTPLRLAKTVVCGAQTLTINKVLSILTYFVRCGEIQRVRSKKVLNKKDIATVISSQVSDAEKLIRRSNGVSGSAESIQTKRLIRTKTYQNNISSMPNNNASNGTLENGTFFKKNDIIPNGELLPTNIENSDCVDAARERYEFEAAHEAIHMDERKCRSSAVNECHSNGTNHIIDKVDASEQSDWNGNVESDSLHIVRWEPMKNAKYCTNIVATYDVGHSLTEGDRQNNNDIYDNSYSNNVDSISKSNNIDSNSIHKKTDYLSSKTTVVACSQHSHFKTSTAKCLQGSSSAQAATLVTMERTALASPPIPRENGKRIDDTCISSYLDVDPIHMPYSIESERTAYTSMDFTNNNARSSANVVFVLGDNDVLSGLKPSPHHASLAPSAIIGMHDEVTTHANDLGEIAASAQSSTHKAHIIYAANGQEHPSNDIPQASTSMALNMVDKKKNCKKHCSHKKHSGVKFNFEQYPQIVTNYMKNKNLDITSYDFLEKGLKLEQENTFNYGASSASVLPIAVPEEGRDSDEHIDDEECECCANTFRILQTPSNATELEFSNDDGNYPVPTAKTTDTTELNEPSEQTVATSSFRSKHLEVNHGRSIQSDSTKKREDAQSTPRSTKEAKKDVLDLIAIPIPKTIFIDETKQRIRPGYVPSLFVGVTDHYIPDMVLQVSHISVIKNVYMDLNDVFLS